jgi:hypothetical protein
MINAPASNLAALGGVRAKSLNHAWCACWAKWIAIIAAMFLVHNAPGATAPIITNFSTITNAQIDATTYVNLGTLRAESIGNGFLFQTLNNLNFTNVNSMVGDVGFDLQFVTNSSRFYANAIVNQGTIRAETILLSATNLVNSGELRAGATGLLQLQGQLVNIGRSVLSASDSSSNTLTGAGFRSTDSNGVVTYQNPSAVTDLYWGAGTGNVMNSFSGQGFGLFLPTLNSTNGGFRPPVVSSPSHEVESVVSGLGTLPSLVSMSGSNYVAHVRTNLQNATNLNIQVVLIQTNAANTNLSVDVRFASFGGANFFSGNTPVVRFSTTGFDITSGASYTNSLFFFDYSNSRTNSVLSANLLTSSSRPAAYELSRSVFNERYFNSTFGLSSNEHITNISYFQSGFASSTVTNNPYAAYQVSVGNSAFAAGTGSFLPHLDDPTNFPGRVEIYADNLDMSLARIRADNLVSIRATNLVGFNGTLIESPYVQLSIANTNSTLTLTNFATSQVARPNGRLTFYSTIWTNSVTNATPQLDLRYHVLIVDASQLSGVTPVTLQEFSARGTNVIINNTLNIGRAIQVDSPAVTFSTSSALNLPLTTATSLSTSNFLGLRFFTNLGAISVPLQCTLGTDRTDPISYFLNRGVITADNISVRATDFENSGTNQTRALVNGTNVGGGGPISIFADSAKFDGGGTGGMLSAGGSILLAGNDIKIRNHQLVTAGSLILSPTNSLTDTGASGTNRVNCAQGFYLTVKPASGDLLGTTIYTAAPFNRDVPHVWAGTNLGPVSAGFTNNAALGRLLLDTSNNPISLNRLSFSGVGTNSALYVDYLDLAGTVTNNLSTHLYIETNFTIYFANSSLPPETLDGQLGGRLRWVKDYAGPNTGVDVLLRDGRTVKVNVAKLNSQILDSDADGVVNGSDLSPFDGIFINSRVTFTNAPPLTAYVTWEAAAQTVYQVEVNTNLLTATWQFLSNFTNTATTNRVVTFSEPVPAGGLERYYRISYQP